MDDELQTTRVMSEWERDWRTTPFRAYINTFKSISFAPAHYFATITPIEDYLSIAVLIYFNTFLLLFFSLALQVAFKFSILPLILTQLNLPLAALSTMMTFFLSLAAAFVLPFFAILFLMLLAGVMHFFFDVVGGTEKKYNTTLTVYALASVIQIFGIVPILGPLVSLVYQLIIHIGGQAAAHEITVPKAFLSWFMPFLICCCCFGGFVVAGAGFTALMGHH